MEALWESSPLTAQEVAEHVRTIGKKVVAVETVKTLLGRLVKKGAITHKQQANRYLYAPKHPRADYVQTESESFLQRIFQGAAAPMLAHFVSNTKLTSEEIEELRKLLDEKEAS